MMHKKNSAKKNDLFDCAFIKIRPKIFHYQSLSMHLDAEKPK